MASDGKMRETDTANTETVFRIIQSIPSPKAEPFKRWLAKVGYERVQEIKNPKLATQRTRAIYKAKGYSDEWDKRGVKIQREYAILTAEISKATFGMTPSEYKKHKGLHQENLRDHMTDLELIFSMLGEAATKEIAAKTGGKIAGDARHQLEQKSGKPIISKENFLENQQLKMKLNEFICHAIELNLCYHQANIESKRLRSSVKSSPVLFCSSACRVEIKTALE